MTDSVAVIIPTFGDREVWCSLADRAKRSVEQQTRQPDEIFVLHRETLQQARNEGALLAATNWLIFLDADDELDPLYIEAMLDGRGDVRQPATLGVYPDGTTDSEPIVITQRHLLTSNYIVIGAMINACQFHQVGGFNDYPFMEDWDLFARLWINGADIQPVPKAIYRVHVREGSRNTNSPDYARCYQTIRERLRLEAAGRGLS